MLNRSDFCELVSGRRPGWRAKLLRSGLRLIETPYALAMRLRNWRYDTGRAEIQRVDVPVISVGNLTLGGTGKTPLVVWIARWLRDRGVRVSLISRGYGAEKGRRNDEALELEQRLPDVPHLLDGDRAAAARIAIDELATQLILLDDGFQHRRLHRDLDIVLLDALEPFGAGHVFPRGLLREPLGGLRRAQAVGLSRADGVSPEERERIRRQVERYAPGVTWFETNHAPQALLSATGSTGPWNSLRGRRVAAFCGIGNPAGFRLTLGRLGCELAAFREFPDHHLFTRDDIQSLMRWVEGMAVDAVLTTHKDLVKIGLEELADRPLWAVTVAIEFLRGQDSLEGRLMPLCAEAKKK